MRKRGTLMGSNDGSINCQTALCQAALEMIKGLVSDFEDSMTAANVAGTDSFIIWDLGRPDKYSSRIQLALTKANQDLPVPEQYSALLVLDSPWNSDWSPDILDRPLLVIEARMQDIDRTDLHEEGPEDGQCLVKMKESIFIINNTSCQCELFDDIPFLVLDVITKFREVFFSSKAALSIDYREDEVLCQGCTESEGIVEEVVSSSSIDDALNQTTH